MMSENGPPPGADAHSWIDLRPAAVISVKSSETGRELRFEGPGRVKPCAVDGAMILEGSAVGLPGAGEGPGSEQWVAASCGVAVWSNGVHRFSASGAGPVNECRLQTSTGASHLYVAKDMTGEESAVDGGAPEAGAPPIPGRFLPLTGRHAVTLRPQKKTLPGEPVRTALAECAKAASDAESVGARLRNRDGGAAAGTGDVGELAVQSIGVRRLARAACAVAAVRVAAAGSKPEDLAALAAAEARFR
ncbi:MAG: hypothetical protein JST00_12725 [Deltaproteobacteria bacterium]|nr:hypothetical protein [Deltaproteobacteria bacterium]